MTIVSADLPKLLAAAAELPSAGADVGGLAAQLTRLGADDPSQTGPALDHLAHQWSTGLTRGRDRPHRPRHPRGHNRGPLRPGRRPGLNPRADPAPPVGA